MIADELARLGVTVKQKSESKLMRFIGAVLAIFGVDFMGRFWTTMGGRTIWAPEHVDVSELEPYAGVIRHELVHIEQARKWPVWFQLSYLLLPVPIGFAYFRWRWERRAYLLDVQSGRLSIEEVVELLWRSYLWTWPKPWMRKWFLSHS